jgi:hypothetical protein
VQKGLKQDLQRHRYWRSLNKKRKQFFFPQQELQRSFGIISLFTRYSLLRTFCGWSSGKFALVSEQFAKSKVCPFTSCWCSIVVLPGTLKWPFTRVLVNVKSFSPQAHTSCLVGCWGRYLEELWDISQPSVFRDIIYIMNLFFELANLGSREFGTRMTHSPFRLHTSRWWSDRQDILDKIHFSGPHAKAFSYVKGTRSSTLLYNYRRELTLAFCSQNLLPIENLCLLHSSNPLVTALFIWFFLSAFLSNYPYDLKLSLYTRREVRSFSMLVEQG